MMNPESEPAMPRWVRLCLLSLGALAVSAAFGPWLTFVVKAGNPNEWGAMPFVAAAPFLALCGINALRVRANKPALVQPAEAAAVFLILLTGGWMATWAYVDNVMPLLTSPPVFASPENGWADKLLPHLPKWAMGPMEEPYASGYYNGLATGAAIPWGRWLMPILVWSLFGGVLTLFALGLAGIVSRQWIEHDRLTFPQIEVLSTITGGIMRDRLFWYGVAAASAVPLFNLIHKAWPLFPKGSLGDKNGVEWLAGADKISTELNLTLLGLLFFVHRDIILSMIVMFFVICLKDKAMTLLGYKLEGGDVYAGAGTIGNLQTQGALIALVLAGLWASRSTLRAYLKTAKDGKDDRWSWLAPRTTVAFFLAGFAGIAAWLYILGLRHPGGQAAFLFSQVTSWLGQSRVVAESSVEIQTPVDAVDMTTLLSGSRALLPAGLAALAVSMCWIYGSGSMNQLTNALQGEKFRTTAPYPRWLAGVVIGGVMLSTAFAMLGTIFVSYRHGANNFGVWHYQYQMRIPYDLATETMRTPHGVDWPRIGWLLTGSAAMLVLIWLRNNVVGLFLHPVGLLLGALGQAAGSPANGLVFTGTLAWGLKTVLIKLGGVETYERYKAFFAGLVVGGVYPAALAFVVNTAYYLVKGRPFA